MPPEREAGHSSPSSVHALNIQNAWRIICTLPIHFRGVLLSHRDSFLFYIFSLPSRLHSDITLRHFVEMVAVIVDVMLNDLFCCS
jgi:hypothetical protein